jgi:hypothetical protein
MKFRNTLILAVVFLALGAYVYFVELEKARKETQKDLLVTFDKDQVEEVTLTYPDREIQIKKDAAGTWTIAKPLYTEADDTTVNNLVNAIAQCEVEKVFDEVPEDLTPYGLDTPHATVKVKLKDGQEVPTIFVGETSPVGFKTYVRKGDEKKIFLTSSSFHYGTDKKVNDLRDKKIVDFTDEEVKKIEITNANKEILLAKDGEDWKLEKPPAYKADAAQVRGLLSSLRSVRAQDFIDNVGADPTVYGLVPPTLSVSLYLGEDEAKKTVLVGGEKPEPGGEKKRYLKRGEKDTVYVVGDWVLRDLNKEVNDLRDKTVLAFDPEKVTKIEVKRKDGEIFTIARGTDKKWMVAGKEGEKPKETALQQFVDDLHELRGYEIAADNPPDLSSYALNTPDLAITVYGDKEEELGTVLAARHGEGESQQTYAMLQGGNTVLTLRDWIFKRMNKHAQDFLEEPKEKTAETKGAEET